MTRAESFRDSASLIFLTSGRMDLYELESLVRSGGALLGETLYGYWPSGEYEGIKERNMTFHLASIFLKNDFSVIAEHKFGEDGESLDMLAIDYHGKLQVRIEAKQLKGNISVIEHDLDKISRFTLIEDEDYYSNKVGVIIASCWRPEISLLWMNPNINDDIEDYKNNGETTIAYLIEANNQRYNIDPNYVSGIYILSHDEAEKRPNYRTRSILYLIYKLSD